MDSNHLGGLQPTDSPKSVYLELAARLLERDDHDMWITALAFDIEQSFRPCPARLIDGDKGLRRQVMLADERGDKPRHHVCPTTRTSWDDELDWFLGLPCLCPSLP